MPRVLNPNLAKIHRNYTVEETASLYCVHKNTVRNWIKAGLPVCDARRPVLILGSELRGFLKQRRQVHRRQCLPHEMYCLRCRAARRPAEGMADYQSVTPATGRIIGLCPVCMTTMNRFVSNRNLGEIRASLDLRMPGTQSHIGDRGIHPVNCDSNKRA